jgi:plasmid stability protein
MRAVKIGEKALTTNRAGGFPMPDLVLENLPQELYDDLRQAAEAHQRSVAEEAMDRLKLKTSRLHLPDEPVLSEEISAPGAIPLPGEGRPIKARRGGPHLPDPPWITIGDR